MYTACPNCGAILTPDETDWGRCYSCGWDEDTLTDYDDEYDEDDEEIESLEAAAFGGHEDVWIEVDGHQQRVFGDPNMPEEARQALGEMIKALTKAIENGELRSNLDNN